MGLKPGELQRFEVSGDARNWIKMGLKLLQETELNHREASRNWIKMGLKQVISAEAYGKHGSRNWIKMGLKHTSYNV